LKQLINKALARTTGYELHRPGPAAPAPAKKAPGPAAKKTAKKAAKKSAKKAAKKVPGRPGGGPRKTAKTAKTAKAKSPKKGPTMPTHYDEAGKQIIRTVKPRTMTGHEKLYGLILAVRHVVQHKIPGDIVECGVWRGGSMQAAALTLLDAGSTDRELHLFDTFEGMPPPTEKDRRPFGKSAEQMLAESDRNAKVWAVATLEDVRAAMDETDYPSEKIHYHPGMVEETVPSEAPERIAILRLDTDWYESTRHELYSLYDRLSPGGVLIIDDYGGWEGSRLATEEFLEDTGARLLLLPIAGGRLAVKPGA
jgi:hypothetical protein